jgi:hypothetical protein
MCECCNYLDELEEWLFETPEEAANRIVDNFLEGIDRILKEAS